MPPATSSSPADPTVRVLHDPTREAYDGAGPRPVRIHEWRTAREDAPLVVLSHGTGGAAQGLAWWASALCDAGFDVVGIDHHGNSHLAGLTALGFVSWWDRPLDVSFVLDQVAVRGPAGAAGFSLGGYTVGAVCGVRLSEQALAPVGEGTMVMSAPPEFPNLFEELEAYAERTGNDLRSTFHQRAAANLRDPRVRAGFLLCPALGPLLDDDATAAAVEVPVMVRWTASDSETPAESNGMRYARAIHGADGAAIGTPESGHYGFVIQEQDDPVAKADVVRDSIDFFRRTLG